MFELTKKMLASHRIARVRARDGTLKFVVQCKFRWDLLGLGWTDATYVSKNCTFDSLDGAVSFVRKMHNKGVEKIDIIYYK